MELFIVAVMSGGILIAMLSYYVKKDMKAELQEQTKQINSRLRKIEETLERIEANSQN